MTGREKTFFAPATRSSAQHIRQEVERITKSPIVEALLSSARGLLAVLNEHRQVVSINRALLDTLGVEDPEEVMGLRPGEMAGCAHANDNQPGGCGTGPSCASCGAVIAIVTSLAEDRSVERTCCIQSNRNAIKRDLFLSVRAQPLSWDGSRWIVLFLQDTSAQQELYYLQRIFFHDISNLVTAMQGYSSVLQQEVPPDLKDDASILKHYSTRLVQELNMQKLLFQSKSRTLQPQLKPVVVDEVLGELVNSCTNHAAAKNKRIRSIDRTNGSIFDTDPAILQRVLTNMLINALESTKSNGEVAVTCENLHESMKFCVTNPGEIPPEVAGHIFQRNFTTKGLGRGLGTYSMKLFGEEIMGGTVDFTSDHGQTTFFFNHPLTLS